MARSILVLSVAMLVGLCAIESHADTMEGKGGELPPFTKLVCTSDSTCPLGYTCPEAEMGNDMTTCKACEVIDDEDKQKKCKDRKNGPTSISGGNILCDFDKNCPKDYGCPSLKSTCKTCNVVYKDESQIKGCKSRPEFVATEIETDKVYSEFRFSGYVRGEVVSEEAPNVPADMWGGAFTIVTRVSVEDTTIDRQFIMGRSDDTNKCNGPYLALKKGTLHSGALCGNENIEYAHNTAYLSPGMTYTVVVVYADGVHTIYVNGEKKATSVKVEKNIFNNPGPINIGSRASEALEGWEGIVCSLSIFKGTVNDEDIKKMSENPVNRDCMAPPTFLWKGVRKARHEKAIFVASPGVPEDMWEDSNGYGSFAVDATVVYEDNLAGEPGARDAWQDVMSRAAKKEGDGDKGECGGFVLGVHKGQWAFGVQCATTVSTNVPAEGGKRYDIVAILDGGKAQLYINGEQKWSGDLKASFSNPSDMVIGAADAKNAELWRGEICRVGVYQGPITESDVRALAKVSEKSGRCTSKEESPETPPGVYALAKNCDADLNGYCMGKHLSKDWENDGVRLVARSFAASEEEAGKVWGCYDERTLSNDMLEFNKASDFKHNFVMDTLGILKVLDTCLSKRGTVALYKPAMGCDSHLNTWCSNTLKGVFAGWGAMSLARRATIDETGGDATDVEEKWYCFRPSALSASTMNYDEMSKDYKEFDKSIVKEIDRCKNIKDKAASVRSCAIADLQDPMWRMLYIGDNTFDTGHRKFTFGDEQDPRAPVRTTIESDSSSKMSEEKEPYTASIELVVQMPSSLKNDEGKEEMAFIMGSECNGPFVKISNKKFVSGVCGMANEVKDTKEASLTPSSRHHVVATFEQKRNKISMKEWKKLQQDKRDGADNSKAVLGNFEGSLYVDGGEVATRTIKDDSAIIGDLADGKYSIGESYDTTQQFSGSVLSATLYDRILGKSEVATRNILAKTWFWNNPHGYTWGSDDDNVSVEDAKVNLQTLTIESIMEYAPSKEEQVLIVQGEECGGYILGVTAKGLTFGTNCDDRPAKTIALYRFEAGERYHVAATYDKVKKAGDLYINGKVIKHVSGDYNFADSSSLRIGSKEQNKFEESNLPFRGRIFMVSIFAEARTNSDISSDFSVLSTLLNPESDTNRKLKFMSLNELRSGADGSCVNRANKSAHRERLMSSIKSKAKIVHSAAVHHHKIQHIVKKKSHSVALHEDAVKPPVQPKSDIHSGQGASKEESTTDTSTDNEEVNVGIVSNDDIDAP